MCKFNTTRAKNCFLRSTKNGASGAPLFGPAGEVSNESEKNLLYMVVIVLYPDPLRPPCLPCCISIEQIIIERTLQINFLYYTLFFFCIRVALETMMTSNEDLLKEA